MYTDETKKERFCGAAKERIETAMPYAGKHITKCPRPNCGGNILDNVCLLCGRGPTDKVSIEVPKVANLRTTTNRRWMRHSF